MSELRKVYVPASVAASNPKLIATLGAPELGQEVVIIADADALVVELDGNGQAPAPEAEAEAPLPEEWVNIAGYPCKRQFTAYISSLNIVKHLNGTCKCKDGKPDECPARDRYGYTDEQFASDKDIVVPAHLHKDYVPA